jgi:hypothetical protein
LVYYFINNQLETSDFIGIYAILRDEVIILKPFS